MEKDNSEMLSNMTGAAKHTGHKLLLVSYGESHHGMLCHAAHCQWGQAGM